MDGAYLLKVRNLTKFSGLQNRVTILPEYIEDVRALFWASDSLWIPSLHEGTPNVMLEGLCCGMPIVINQELGMQSHVKDGKNGFNVALKAGAFSTAALMAVESFKPGSARKNIAVHAKGKYDAAALDSELMEHLHHCFALSRE